MAIGAMQAVMAANPPKWPVLVGEGRCQFLQLWDQRLKEDPNFETIAVANPPGVSPTGLRIAVNMLMGKQVDKSKLGGTNGLSFVIPVPVIVTKDNFQEVFIWQTPLCHRHESDYGTSLRYSRYCYSHRNIRPLRDARRAWWLSGGREYWCCPHLHWRSLSLSFDRSGRCRQHVADRRQRKLFRHNGGSAGADPDH